LRRAARADGSQGDADDDDDEKEDKEKKDEEHMMASADEPLSSILN